jgi:hypothetical protein
LDPAQTTATPEVRENPTSKGLLPLRTVFSGLFFQGMQAELHAFQNYS